MSAFGPKRTWPRALHMSAFGGKADMIFQEIRFRGRYWEQSGHCFLQRTCPLMTQSGHWLTPCLIPSSVRPPDAASWSGQRWRPQIRPKSRTDVHVSTCYFRTSVGFRGRRMPEERVDRRLAAIWAGDIAGYSRLMGVDEEGTLRQLKAHRRELVDPKI